MTKKRKCYIYTRVSTAMQVDGYSLDAQKEKLKKYAAYEEMQIVGEYSDEGHSGKNIAGSLEAVGKSVCLHIISRSKTFDLFPRTDKGKNRCVFRQNYALINSRERPQIFDINLEQSSHCETICTLSRKK